MSVINTLRDELRSVSWASVRTVFTLDLRSIALFRIALALLILADLVLRSADLTNFYTDGGVLPRRYWLELTHPLHASLHAASGELWWQLLLFVLAALSGAGLAIGYRSKLMAVLSFVLLTSLLNRNGLILQGGDQLLAVMSFWSLFLPLGARWSIDAALQPEHRTNPNVPRFDPQTVQAWFTIATIAIVFQVLFLYFFTALLKTGDAWRVRFDAAFYAISLQHFATPIAIWVRQFPWVLTVGTLYVLVVEFIAPLLVLAPFRWPWLRLIGLALLASLHVAFLLMLHIGLFPLIDFMSLSLLIPSVVWIWLARRTSNPRHEAIVLYYDEDCGFCLKMCLILREFLLPDTVKILQAQQYPAIFAVMDRENTWVVTDADGQRYIHWHAMAFLFCQRWPFKPLGWLMRLPPLMAIGNRVYGWVAVNRYIMSRITERWAPYRPLRLKRSLIGGGLALFFFVVVVIYNVSGLPDRAGLRTAFPFVEPAARVTRTDQRWDMFAPFPLTISLYPRIPGTLRNGDEVDVYALTSSEAGWVAPENMYSLYESYRWRKYMGRVFNHSNNTVRRSFGDYLCRTWNTPDRPRQQQLATLEVHFVKLRTNTAGTPKSSESSMVWRHWCYAEFAPKDA